MLPLLCSFLVGERGVAVVEEGIRPFVVVVGHNLERDREGYLDVAASAGHMGSDVVVVEEGQCCTLVLGIHERVVLIRAMVATRIPEEGEADSRMECDVVDVGAGDGFHGAVLAYMDLVASVIS